MVVYPKDEIMRLRMRIYTDLKVCVQGVVRGRTWDPTDMGSDRHGIGRTWDPFWDRCDLPWDFFWEQTDMGSLLGSL